MSRKELASRMMAVLVGSKVGSLLSMKIYYSGTVVNSIDNSAPRVKKKVRSEGIKVHHSTGSYPNIELSTRHVIQGYDINVKIKVLLYCDIAHNSLLL